MTEENIRKMVEKYEIKDNRDGRIRAYHVKTDEEKKQIGEHKAEILAYLKREAVFALDMEYKKGSANYELAGIAEKAYNALCNGEAWEAVKKQYDKDNDEFVLRHVWD